MLRNFVFFCSLAAVVFLFTGCSQSAKIGSTPITEQDKANAYSEPKTDYNQKSSLTKPFDYKAEEEKSNKTPKKSIKVVTPDQIN